MELRIASRQLYTYPQNTTIPVPFISKTPKKSKLIQTIFYGFSHKRHAEQVRIRNPIIWDPQAT